MTEKQLEGVDRILRHPPREIGLSGNLWDGKTLSTWIEQRYGIAIGVRQCQRMFRQLGFRLRKPRPALAQANPAMQKAHKKTQDLMQDDSVDLWATDEVHFQQHGSRCRMWIPPEIKDPVLLHAPTRKSVGYFGAVRLRDGRFVFRLETGKLMDSASFSFSRIRSASRGTRRRVVVITDNARYHHSRLHRPGWNNPPIKLLGLPSPVQSRTQSDRARVEAHTSSLPAQSLLRQAPRRHQRG